MKELRNIKNIDVTNRERGSEAIVQSTKWQKQVPNMNANWKAYLTSEDLLNNFIKLSTMWFIAIYQFCKGFFFDIKIATTKIIK